MERKTFVSMNVTPEARDRLRLASLQIGLDVGRKISLADALLAALATAQEHPEELRAHARRITGTEEEPTP